MNRIIRNTLAICGLTTLLIVATPAPIYAIDALETACSDTNNDSEVCKAKTDSATEMIRIIINTLLFVLAIIAVIMIITGGLRYTTSNGDPSKTKAAKDTVLYAVIGLIVAVMAFPIVNFVIDRFGTTTTSTTESTTKKP